MYVILTARRERCEHATVRFAVVVHVGNTDCAACEPDVQEELNVERKWQFYIDYVFYETKRLYCFPFITAAAAFFYWLAQLANPPSSFFHVSQDVHADASSPTRWAR